MNALVAKEIRLLLPACGLALLLAVVPVWLLPAKYTPARDFAGAIVLGPFWFGFVMLALSAFGREFGLQTFPLLLAQPLERRRIWWTKIAVLASAMAMVSAAWCLSCAACAYMGQEKPAWFEWLKVAGMTAVVTFAGGLWTTLLFRQVAAAFWFTILFPGAIMTVIGINRGTYPMIFAALGLYSVAGFLWAWWLFFRAQEVSWTGGVIGISGWRAAEAVSRPSRRSRRPLAALLGKELQLHQVGLAGMGLLFVLHLGVVAVRKAGPDVLGEMLYAALVVFGSVWLIVPLLAGSQSVAEERKLGTIEEHLCLPVSRRLQFVLKLVVVLVLGGLLSAFLLWTAEGIASAVGAGSIFRELRLDSLGTVWLGLIFLALSLLGFYASTLARNLVQALAVAVVTSLGVWILGVFASRLPYTVSRWLWQGRLVYFFAWPALTATFLWLAWRNLQSGSETWRLWRRNVLGLAGALVFIGGFTTVIYHRAWEWLAPLEPAHGPARLAGAKPSILRTGYDGTRLALLPDGRLWVGHFVQPTELEYIGRKLPSLSGYHFVEGSNWVDAVANSRETVGIRSDGTLWRWRLADFRGNTNGPGLPAPAPQRLGTESDWAKVLSVSMDPRSFVDGRIFAWSRDGRAWFYSSDRGGNRLLDPVREPFWRWPSLDHLPWRSLTMYPNLPVGVRADGTLWISEKLAGTMTSGSIWSWSNSPKLVRFGRDADWVAVAAARHSSSDNISTIMLVALKADGSLWTWEFGYKHWAAFKADDSFWTWEFGYKHRQEMWLPTKPLVRLGTHTDWVAVSSLSGRIVSLAADGSLWYWRNPHNAYRDGSLLATSRKPAKIENIFDHQE